MKPKHFRFLYIDCCANCKFCEVKKYSFCIKHQFSIGIDQEETICDDWIGNETREEFGKKEVNKIPAIRELKGYCILPDNIILKPDNFPKNIIVVFDNNISSIDAIHGIGELIEDDNNRLMVRVYKLRKDSIINDADYIKTKVFSLMLRCKRSIVLDAEKTEVVAISLVDRLEGNPIIEAIY